MPELVCNGTAKAAEQQLRTFDVTCAAGHRHQQLIPRPQLEGTMMGMMCPTSARLMRIHHLRSLSPQKANSLQTLQNLLSLLHWQEASSPSTDDLHAQ